MQYVTCVTACSSKISVPVVFSCFHMCSKPIVLNKKNQCNAIVDVHVH